MRFPRSKLLPLVSPQLLACIVIWVSISLRSYGLNIYTYPPALASPQLLAFTLFSISKVPPLCPSTTSYVHLVSISKLPPRCPSATSWESIWFHIWFPRCLSAFSCMHPVSKSRLPPLVSPQRLACFVIWVQCLGFTRHLSATYCAHLVFNI